MSLIYRIMYILFKWPVKWFCRIHVHGKRNEPGRRDGAFLLCSNHVSNLDPLILCDVLRHWQPYYMTKSELFKNPVLGGFLRTFGAFPIHRGGADTAAMKTAVALLKKPRVVAMFPQGHRNPGVPPEQTRIMPGAGWLAEKAGVPILPVLIKPRDFKQKLFRRVDVYVGKPIYPEDLAHIPAGPHRSMEITKYAFERICNADREVNDA
ncbi:MAG: 1-acyl-sn-glycerol-3-phosphate acyltransferase [Clostridia bacterium]|nr:1-acyl-sn-glycerol-3-phosphate acyltransferase [Clostridia bacterium]